MSSFHIAAVVALAVAAPAWAATEAEIDRVIEAVGLPEVMQIMADEGIEHGRELQAELLGDRGSESWGAAIGALYDPQAMMAVFRPSMAEALAEADAEPVLDFFESDLGQRIVTLEIEARRAMRDKDIEAVAKETLAQMQDDDDPRLDLLEDFVETNDLIEFNVVGALNANYAFLTGLADGGAFRGEMTEDQILADVWTQEAEIRLDTTEWVYSYLALAYRPLSDDELAAYTAMSESPAGRHLNRALFAAFDDMYRVVSRGLGKAAADILSGQDI